MPGLSPSSFSSISTISAENSCLVYADTIHMRSHPDRAEVASADTPVQKLEQRFPGFLTGFQFL